MFVPLNTDLLKFRLGEEPGLDADWFVPHMADLITYAPNGCFALMDQDQALGAC